MIKGCMVGDQTVVTSKIHRAIVFSATVWFTATSNFLNILHHVLLIHFVPNLATSMASILVATLSLGATVCRRLGVASFGTKHA
jgi:hypothetical protein